MSLSSLLFNIFIRFSFYIIISNLCGLGYEQQLAVLLILLIALKDTGLELIIKMTNSLEKCYNQYTDRLIIGSN